MKIQQSGFLRYVLILTLVVALVRFFPVIVRMLQGAAIGARGYWWAILPAIVISWITWRMFKRASIAKKSRHQFESQRIRDVTDTAQGQHDKTKTPKITKN